MHVCLPQNPTDLPISTARDAAKPTLPQRSRRRGSSLLFSSLKRLKKLIWQSRKPWFADNHNFDLSRIFQLCFNAFCDIVYQPFRDHVGYFIRFYMTESRGRPEWQRIYPLPSKESAICSRFSNVWIMIPDFPAGRGTRSRNSVCRLYQTSFQSNGLSSPWCAAMALTTSAFSPYFLAWSAPMVTWGPSTSGQ